MGLRHALLAGLELEPRSGYDLSRWFANVASHYWAASHSSIYPALAELEREGLVVHVRAPSARGPARKVYSLTPAGREALLAWVETPAADIEVRDEQLVKALCYGLLAADRAIALLQGARARYAERLGHYEQVARSLEAVEPAPAGPLPAARLGMLLTVRCGIHIAQAYTDWCDEAIALVQGEEA